MAHSWVLSEKEINISDETVGFFRKLTNFGGETADVYIIDNKSPELALSAQTIRVRFDFGYLSLPKGIKMVNYQLHPDGTLNGASLQQRSAPLEFRFWGKVLFNLHRGAPESRIYPKDVELHSDPAVISPPDTMPGSFHPCDYFNDPANPVSAKHGGCPIPIMYDFNPDQCQTSLHVPVFHIEDALTGEEALGHSGYYLIPMLLPEKSIVFHAVAADDEAKSKLDSNWFIKLSKFADAGNTADFLVVDAKQNNALDMQRNDEVGITYALNIDLVRVKSGLDGALGEIISWEEVA